MNWDFIGACILFGGVGLLILLIMFLIKDENS